MKSIKTSSVYSLIFLRVLRVLESVMLEKEKPPSKSVFASSSGRITEKGGMLKSSESQSMLQSSAKGNVWGTPRLRDVRTNTTLYYTDFLREKELEEAVMSHFRERDMLTAKKESGDGFVKEKSTILAKCYY